MSTIRVEIVRPQTKWSYGLIKAVVFAPYFLLAGWLFMLIAGTVTDWGLSWWHSVLVVYGAQLLQRANLGYLNWTAAR